MRLFNDFCAAFTQITINNQNMHRVLYQSVIFGGKTMGIIAKIKMS